MTEGPFAPSKLKIAINRLKMLFSFLYNLFITINLCYLGYAEGIRLKNILIFIDKNSKILRIKDVYSQINN